MSSEFIKDQQEKYSKGFLEHGDSAKGVLWHDKASQYLRFDRLLKNFDLDSNPSIHDIGCGIAAMHEYMNEKRIAHQYYGTEIVPEMIEYARKKYPGIKLFQRDILTDTTVETCDISIISGIFNLAGNQDQEKWKEYCFSVIKRAFELSNKGLAFNFLTSHRTFSDSTLAYFDPTEVFNFCMSHLSRYVILDHAYPLYEFTITVYKNGYTKSQYPGEDFSKYFRNDK